MNYLHYRMLTLVACLMCALSLLIANTTFAQEGEGESDPKTQSESAKTDEAKKEEKEGPDAAALAAARERFGPNKATAKIGEKEIFLIGPKVEIKEDPDYPKVDELKDGEIIVMTLGQATKLSTQFDLKFGDAVIKNANFHPDYPGVYSVWIKKRGDGWNLVFNEKPDVWSTMHKDEFDVGETSDVMYFRLGQPEKSLKFDVYAEGDSGMLTIRWGKHEWKAPFTIQQ